MFVSVLILSLVPFALAEDAPSSSQADNSNPSGNKMFFWPIWTKSTMPFLPTYGNAGNMPNDSKMLWNRMLADAEANVPKDSKEHDNKMFFWPIWTKSSKSDMPQGMPLMKDFEGNMPNDSKGVSSLTFQFNRMLAGAEANVPKDSKKYDDKMFFWPIWTSRSNIQVPAETENSNADSTKSQDETNSNADSTKAQDSKTPLLRGSSKSQDESKTPLLRGNSKSKHNDDEENDDKMWFWY